MSYYYKYDFISPEPIYATVKEELKSYFDTGAVDDLMFPTYLDKCLRKLGRTTYKITTEVLFIEDFEARLPDNFHAVREAWMCTAIPGNPYPAASSFYSQAANATTIQIAPLTIGGTPCNNPKCQNERCDGTCMPELVQAVYKTNNEIARAYRRTYLLKPGNISTRKHCDVSYTNSWDQYNQLAIRGREFTPDSSSYDSFDIRDNKFVTNFRKGVVHLVFYATDYDHTGNQLVPDNYRVREYIESFIKFKVFETLTNQTNDETFNQLQTKLAYHKSMMDEAYILAEIEIKKQTAYQKQRRVVTDLNRFNMYELPNSISQVSGRYTNRYWRRNGYN
tara:strand:- start:944 stop:1948 length:1005 start_codon:yes stop_codon:yes gene_type:complete